MRLRRSRATINFALQGGGAHGAFTWGVLDRFLEQDNIDIGWISATSAGAVNAVALVAGLAAGGREGARAKLTEMWHAVHKAGVADLMRLNPFLYSLSRSASMAQVASLWSPYEVNVMGYDPLRRLLGDVIDFDAVRKYDGIELLIAATEVATGRPRLFRRSELTVDGVLASACLPTLHRAVEIDGVAYWDGGFSANPDLVTIATESPVRDTLIVQLTPLAKSDLPTGVREIQAQMSRLTFSAPLLRDVEIIETVRETMRGFFRPRNARMQRLADHRFHLIEAGRYTAALSDDSKMKPDLDLLTHLFGAGRTEANKWLFNHRSAIGRRTTVDLRAHFLAPHGAGAREVAVRETPGADTAVAARGR